MRKPVGYYLICFFLFSLFRSPVSVFLLLREIFLTNVFLLLSEIFLTSAFLLLSEIFHFMVVLLIIAFQGLIISCRFKYFPGFRGSFFFFLCGLICHGFFLCSFYPG